MVTDAKALNVTQNASAQENEIANDASVPTKNEITCLIISKFKVKCALMRNRTAKKFPNGNLRQNKTKKRSKKRQKES